MHRNLKFGAAALCAATVIGFFVVPDDAQAFGHRRRHRRGNGGCCGAYVQSTCGGYGNSHSYANACGPSQAYCAPQPSCSGTTANYGPETYGGQGALNDMPPPPNGQSSPSTSSPSDATGGAAAGPGAIGGGVGGGPTDSATPPPPQQ